MYIGELAALFTAVLWSGTSVAFAEASKLLGSSLVNLIRMIAGIVFLSLTLLLFNIDTNLNNTQFTFLIISGVIGIAIGDAFLFKALDLIGPRLSMLMMSIAPIIAAFLAFFFLNENLSLWGVVGIIITFIGIFIVIAQKHEQTEKKSTKIIGVVCAFFAAAGQGAGLIFAKVAFNEGPINGFFATFVRLTAALIVFYPILLLSKRLKKPIDKIKNSRKGLIYSLVGAFIGPYLGITFSLIAISKTYVGIASTLMSTVPIIMLPIVYFFYKEKLSFSSILGAVVAVLGISVLFLKN